MANECAGYRSLERETGGQCPEWKLELGKKSNLNFEYVIILLKLITLIKS